MIEARRNSKIFKWIAISFIVLFVLLIAALTGVTWVMRAPCVRSVHCAQTPSIHSCTHNTNRALPTFFAPRRLQPALQPAGTACWRWSRRPKSQTASS
jgi:uncharacterized membrane protein